MIDEKSGTLVTSESISGTAPADLQDNEQVKGSVGDVVIAIKPQAESVFAPSTISVDESDASVTAAAANEINEMWLDSFRQNHEARFLDLLREEDCDFTERSQADSLFCTLMEGNSLAAMEWIGDLFIRHFDDDVVATGILVVLSHLSFSEVRSTGRTVAMSALLHPSAAVREGGVRVFELWELPEAIELLEKLWIGETWLRDYANEVIEDLKLLTRHAATS